MCRLLLADSNFLLAFDDINCRGRWLVLTPSVTVKQNYACFHAESACFFFVYCGKCSAESVVFVGNDVA